MNGQADIDLIRDVNNLQQTVDGMIRPEISRWPSIVSMYQNIPGLVGFWPMSSVQRSTGKAYDLSGQSRMLTYNAPLSPANVPLYKIFNDFMPYIDFGTSTGYLSRADETDLDILGTEAHNVGGSPGLTVGGWIQDNIAGSGTSYFSKWNTAANRSWLVSKNAGNSFLFTISTDGLSISGQAISAVTFATSTWFSVIGRLVPSGSTDIFINGVKDSDTTGPPASIFNSTASLEVGSLDAGASALLNGHASLYFLSANALSDTYINGLFQQSRVLFGV